MNKNKLIIINLFLMTSSSYSSESPISIKEETYLNHPKKVEILLNKAIRCINDNNTINEKKSIFRYCLDFLTTKNQENIQKVVALLETIKEDFVEKLLDHGPITEQEDGLLVELMDLLNNNKLNEEYCTEIFPLLNDIINKYDLIDKEKLDIIRKKLLEKISTLHNKENNLEEEWIDHFLRLLKNLITPFIVFDKDKYQYNKDEKKLKLFITTNIIGMGESSIISEFTRYWEEILPEENEIKKNEIDILRVLWDKSTIHKIKSFLKKDTCSLFNTKIENFGIQEVDDTHIILKLTQKIITENKEQYPSIFNTAKN